MTRFVRLVLAMAACGGCSYDWQIPADTADAASGPEAGREAAVDSALPDAIPDAATEAVADDAMDAPVDSTLAPDADAAVDCAALHRELDSTEQAAKVCHATATDCMTYVTDQCGCIEFLDQPASAETAAYEAALATFMSSGCPTNCLLCPTPAPTHSFCLVNSTGTGTACDP